MRMLKTTSKPMLLAAAVCGLASPSCSLTAHDSKPALGIPAEITFRTADIRSEGTRMAAQVFAPKEPKQRKLPTIILSYGWGGVAEDLRPDAIAFAKAGYLIVTFDYRGWGKSDSRWIPAGGEPEPKDGRLMAEVKEVRGVVDPIDQTTDLMNVIHWTVGEPQCDPQRLGLWGSSFAGGHVVHVAARDPRVKAFVTQVASMDHRWVVDPWIRDYTFSQGTARTRGKIGYPKPGETFGGLPGPPVIEKFIGYAPIEDLGRCERVAKLFIIAENDEVVKNREHSIPAHERATGVKKLVTVEGVGHTEIRSQKRQEAQQLALDWFDEHLKKGTP